MPAEAEQVFGAERLMARIDQLALISESPDQLTRLPFTPSHLTANDRVAGWMKAAGTSWRHDAAGNLIGRYDATTPDAPVLMIGSHIDTVRDAGRFDGTLGILAGIELVDALAREGKRLPFAIEIVAFADEEGVRFGASRVGSRAIAGILRPEDLDIVDDAGRTLATAMAECGFDPAKLGDAAYDGTPLLGYLEVHIEQGPVLEREGLALGCVSAIAGSARRRYEIVGEQGHAGTVPMPGRLDALCAASECVLAVERICAEEDMVGTVGYLDNHPNGGNVVPGRVRFSTDIRHQDDTVLARRSAMIDDEFDAIASRRGVTIAQQIGSGSPPCPCAPEMIAAIRSALSRAGLPDRVLTSGAGHDGIAMSRIAPIGMVFVRCAGGISHHPSESVEAEDVAAALAVLRHSVDILAETVS